MNAALLGKGIFDVKLNSYVDDNNTPQVEVSERLKKRVKLDHPRYFGDIESEDLDDPEKRKLCWKVAKRTVAVQRKRLVVSRRMKNRIYSLQSLTNHLNPKNLINENAQSTLNAYLSGAAETLFNRMLKSSTRQKYTPVLRQFALTLNLYSTKAYNYVRNKFNRSLPHVRTLTKWYSTIGGLPGFSKEALSALKMNISEAAKKYVV